MTADVYNAIIDHNLVASTKGSAVNIDENGIVRFRDIIVTKVPEKYMRKARLSSSHLITSVVPLLVSTTRTIESEVFDGVALQGAGSSWFIYLDDNKAAIFSATPKA